MLLIFIYFKESNDKMNTYEKILKKGIFGFKTLNAREDYLPEGVARTLLKQTGA